MTNEKPPIAPPNKAIDYMIADAMDGDGKGPLAASYQAWHQAEVQKKTPKSGTVDMTAIHAEVTAKSSDWAKGVSDTYAASQDAEKQDNQLKLNPQGIITTLMNGGGIMGVIGGILSELKPVKDFVATVTAWLGSKIGHMIDKDTPSLSFAEASEQTKMANNSNAAFNQMSEAGYVADPAKFAQALNNSPTREASATPAAAPMAANIPLDESLVQQNASKLSSGAVDQIEALKKDGKLVLNEGKPFATQEALGILDAIPKQSLPGRVGNSWAVKE